MNKPLGTFSQIVVFRVESGWLHPIFITCKKFYFPTK